jgi:predicted TIM-barrel fold metal-dependent hydrolase
VHVFEPARFPYAVQRSYTPGVADVLALRGMLQGMGLGRVVLVQPSVYGIDNACMVDALHQLGAAARGIAVVDLERVTRDEAARLHDAGVRGVRLNIHTSGTGLEAARQQVRLAGRVLAWHGWSLQVHAAMDVQVALLDAFRALEHPVVLDHYAGGLPSAAVESAGEAQLTALTEAMRNSPLYVKLSAPYRLAPGSGPEQTRHWMHLARRFAQAAPTQILWGSDWPHTGGSGQRAGGAGLDAIEPFRPIDNARVLADLLVCLEGIQPHGGDLRQRLLVRNPAALYGFDA